MKTFNNYMIAALFSTTSVLAFSNLAGAAPANTGTGNGTGGCQLAPAQQNIYNELLKVIAPLQQQIWPNRPKSARNMLVIRLMPAGSRP